MASGSTATFTFPFEVTLPSDLKVFFGNTLQPANTYLISGLGNNNGGSVTFNSIPPASTFITIRRQVERGRTADYQQEGQFRAAVVNADFDRLQAQLTELGTEVDSRVLKLSETAPLSISIQLPDAQPGQLFGWNSTGDAVVNYSVTTLPQQALALPLAINQGGTGGTTDVQARANLGVTKGLAPGNVAEIQSNGKLDPQLVPQTNNSGSLLYLSRTFA